MNPMNFSSSSRCVGGLLCAFLVSIALAIPLAHAAPGAHGPNGEHLDAPVQSAAAAGGTIPRIEAHSEAFELVGRLQGGELSLLINRYETNEPVLEATVEVESGALKANAKYRADPGDYAITDPNMLKALTEPGEHPLVITILAGKESDLLDGVLNTPGGAASATEHGHSHEGEGEGHTHGFSFKRSTAWLALALVMLIAIGWFFGRTPKFGADSRSTGGVQ